MYKPKKNLLEKSFDVLNIAMMFMLMLIFLYPFWDTLVLSFSTPAGATKLGLRLLPDNMTFFSYSKVFESDYLYIAYFNTIVRTITGVLLTTLVTFCGAYTLAKKNLPYRKVITVFVITTMFFSGGLIPSYLLIRSLGLTNTIWALVLPHLTSAWNLIIARNFISSIPKELEESASIDGAGVYRIIFKIIFPVSMPILAVLALWSAVYHWNAWFDAMIYVRGKEKVVLQLLLRRIIIENSNEFMDNDAISVIGQESTPATVKAATIMVSIGPIIMVYPFLQKYFVKGIMIGSLKG